MPNVQSLDCLFLTTADYKSMLYGKTEWDSMNTKRKQQGLNALIDNGELCQSETIVERFAKTKDQTQSLFTKTEKFDHDDLMFQSIKDEVLAARKCKNWKDFV